MSDPHRGQGLASSLAIPLTILALGDSLAAPIVSREVFGNPGTVHPVERVETGRLFEHGTMEERKRVVRTFVEKLTVDGSSQSGELRIKRLPMPPSRSTGSSFESLAGAGFEPATFGL
jgi:hypothetical protein